MSKPAIRNLSLGSLAGAILGFVFLFLSFIGAATQTTSDPATGATTVHINSVGNPALLVLSILLFIVAGIVGFIAWIGALIRTAKVQRWAWFAAILVIGPVVALIYSFVGPDAPSAPAYPQSQYPPQPLPTN
ncbi:MAG: hypothetical protein H0X24_16825 [Ktedonobacterales bacterium]|nr:hypothetical protein [Ktedonobacterales bacterium]